MNGPRMRASKVDALDLAAIWPCCAQLGGLYLPPGETAGPREPERSDEVDGDGI